MRNVLPKTVRKDYIKSVTTHADLWCERCLARIVICASLLNTTVSFATHVCFGLIHYLC